MATEVVQWIFDEEGTSPKLNEMLAQNPLTILLAATPESKVKSITATAYGAADFTLLVSPVTGQKVDIRFLHKCSGSQTGTIEARVVYGGTEVAQTSDSTTSATYEPGLLSLAMSSLTTHGDVTGHEVRINLYAKTTSAGTPHMIKSFVVTSSQDSDTLDLI